MQLKPRDYQILAADHATEFLRNAKPRDRRPYAGPTGSGKSVIELMLLERFPGAYLVTPRVEIVAGLLEKLGVRDVTPQSTPQLGEQHRISTPVRLRNRLAAGTVAPPSHLIIDEGHHWLTSVSDELDALTGEVPAVAFTATPFRGTPRSTARYREIWGEPVWILTFAEAAQRGVLSVPTCKVVPLVDDDVISVTSAGEFVVQQASELVQSRLSAVVELATPWYDGSQWDRPTMFAVPTVDNALLLTELLKRAALPATCVIGESSASSRATSFAACVTRAAALVQINVVSEGVDLPIRRLVDCHPCMSPVEWQQRFGRITRPVGPSERPPEYVCCCRNLLRHAYLLDGCLPPETLAQAEAAFNGPSKRAGVRVVGFEGLGRFKAAELPLRGGASGIMYCLSRVEANQVTEYAVLASPGSMEPIAAQRTNTGEPGQRKYGRWRRIERVPELSEGFASVPPAPVTEKQAAWWSRDAGRFGLDATAAVNRRSFAALPVLADLRAKL